MKKIILTTLNARYTHTSIGLRYLFANLKELQETAVVMEFTINENIQTIAEDILKHQPKIIGIGVYIWNASEVQELVEIVKKVSPDTKLILGGPEVSHFPLRVNFDSADFIIRGEGEISFYTLCKDLLDGKKLENRVIRAQVPNVKEIILPYAYCSDHDIAHRYTYVEASRGCPFACEFCLSSIDERVRYFDIDQFIDALEVLWQRGSRNFKFIDRTFNLNMKHANKLIDFFLTKAPPFSLHFEVIPDNFPNRLKARLKKFPAASLQLEIGIQTLKTDIAENINRYLNISKIKENIAFLERETHAHMHLDLIVGLPGETIESFGENLDMLCAMTHSEIQIGILKKLSGTTISRHDKVYGMVYSDKPPYDILQNDLISFEEMQKMKRFARFWDIAYNSGNFSQTVVYLWKDSSVFASFYAFSEWIYTQTASTWQISLNRFSELLFRYLTEIQKYDSQLIADTVIEDIIKVNGRSIPGYLRAYASHIPDLRKTDVSKYNKRQILHTM